MAVDLSPNKSFMIDDCASFPTYTLKVNMEGCEKCAVRLKKNLAKVDGVHGVDVDAEKGVVRVSGEVDHRKLIRKIEEKMEKVKLLSDEDPIMINQNEDCIEMQKNKAVYVKKDDHDFDDHVPAKMYEDFECKDSHCRFEYEKPIMHGNHYVPTVKHHLPNSYWLPPAQPNLQHPRNFGRPPMVPQYGHGGSCLGNDLHCRFPPSRPHWFSPPNAHWFPPPPNLHHPQYYGGPIVPQYDNGGYFPVTDHDTSHMWPLLRPLSPYDHYGARHMPASNDFTHFFSDDNSAGCTVM